MFKTLDLITFKTFIASKPLKGSQFLNLLLVKNFKLVSQISKWLENRTLQIFYGGIWLEATVAHIIASLCVCEFIGWMAAAKFPSNMGFNVCNHDMSYWILAWVGLASNLLLCLYRVRASVRVIENIEFQNTSAKSILNKQVWF